MADQYKIISTVVLEEEQPLSLEELCYAINVKTDIVIEMVEYELIQPKGKQPKEWQFDALCLKRAKLARNFYHDLEVNMQGIALALDLLEQIETLEQKVNTLKKHLE